MILDKRSSSILNHICESSHLVSLKELSKKYNISERSIRYDFKKINQWLQNKNMACLQIVHGKGIDLDPNYKKSIQSELTNISPYYYVNSSNERKKIIALRLLNAPTPLTIKYLERELLVSKNTILKELKDLKDWFEKRELKLVSKPHVGYYLMGEENKKRRFVKELMTEILNKDMAIDIIGGINNECVIDNGVYKEIKNIFKDIDINFIEECIKCAEDFLEREFTYNAHINLVTHLAIAIKRLQNNKKIIMDEENIRRIEKFNEIEIGKIICEKIEKRFNISIPLAEVAYLTMHLIGSNVHKDFKLNNNDTLVSQLVLYLISEFEQRYKMTIVDKLSLVNNLTLHLRPALYRMKFNVLIENPLLSEIKEKYKDIYNITHSIFKDFENTYEIQVNEHEIAYITIHFAAAIHAQKNNIKTRVKVLIVCGSGIGTAKLLETQLKLKFPALKIIDTISVFDCPKYDERHADFIISTLHIPENKIPIIRVSSLLNNHDCRLIENTLNTSSKRLNNQFENRLVKIMSSISNHCTIHNYEQLQNEIAYILINNNNSNVLKGGKPMLNELITRENIRLNVNALDWEDAVKKGSQILLDKEYITNDYVNAILTKIKEIGPYIVIVPNIALPHARPEEGVKKLSMSLITLKKPINFGSVDNDPVKLVITLAAIDNETHIKALSQLMDLLSNSEDIENIINATKVIDVINIIEKYSVGKEV
ncbi:BglG family transcription antiterminator [Anaeromicrobium sediminis]|nr:BglG family transcription antiterminator [Anaeromicrobium sediminis]